MAVKPIPDRYHSVTPYLTVRGATKIIDFSQAGLSAPNYRMRRSSGHCDSLAISRVLPFAVAMHRY